MTSFNIAVVGSGISGLSASWLLAKNHRVTLFEAEARPGGHTNTVNMDIDGKSAPVDTGFICYNEATYPNLIELLRTLDVPVSRTEMSFAASMNGGAYEYAGGTWLGMVGQPGNVFRAGHWRLINDIFRFFRTAGKTMDAIPDDETLGQYVAREGYSQEFCNRHLIPMAAAIWSSKTGDMMLYPARAFIRFFYNHGLLKMYGRPEWRSIIGGSKTYVDKLLADAPINLRCNTPIVGIERLDTGVTLKTIDGTIEQFDQVVIASHADQALTMLTDPDAVERSLLSKFSYSDNKAVLHRDRRYMPKRRLTWASWNYMDWAKSHLQPANDEPETCVTYWMNKLQKLPTKENIFVTLNPPKDADIQAVAASFDYSHPVFDIAALKAQRDIWEIQGQNRTWYCGAHFGSGFHEDGLQSGLAVAEQLGGMRRPWSVDNESGRIFISENAGLREAAE